MSMVCSHVEPFKNVHFQSITLFLRYVVDHYLLLVQILKGHLSWVFFFITCNIDYTIW